MITLKLWNSMSQDNRDLIAKTVQKNISTGVSLPYHHDFGHDSIGKSLRKILECCNLQKDGSINVVMNFKPTIDTTKKTVVKAKTSTVKESKKEIKVNDDDDFKEHTWKCRVYTEDDPDDGFWSTAYGYTEQDAEDYIRDEYHHVTRVTVWCRED